MSAFLTLAPIQSASYPSHTMKSPVSEPASLTATPVGEAAAVDVIVPAPTERHRSDSTCSTRGFLKLGPVHFGGEPGVGDYSEE